MVPPGVPRSIFYPSKQTKTQFTTHFPHCLPAVERVPEPKLKHPPLTYRTMCYYVCETSSLQVHFSIACFQIRAGTQKKRVQMRCCGGDCGTVGAWNFARRPKRQQSASASAVSPVPTTNQAVPCAECSIRFTRLKLECFPLRIFCYFFNPTVAHGIHSCVLCELACFTHLSF